MLLVPAYGPASLPVTECHWREAERRPLAPPIPASEQSPYPADQAPPADHGLVFPSRRRTPMEPDNLRRNWSTIRAQAGLAGARRHDCRHTCVTLLLDLGVPPNVVRNIVGHSDIEVTMTIYAHLSLEEKRKALGSVEALG
jgi:integrase